MSNSKQTGSSNIQSSRNDNDRQAKKSNGDMSSFSLVNLLRN